MTSPESPGHWSPPDAPAVVSGQDFVVVKDNLITELYTFIDQP
ncbi:hypothetical protein [Rhodococcoides fascians]